MLNSDWLEEDLWKKLKRLIHNLGLDENFSFIGHVNQEPLLKYYQNATIFVHTSYHEGLPTTILEAMSCELPVVATAVTGTSEVIRDGETGFLIPPKDHKRLARAILSLLNDNNLRDRMGENARKHVEKYYDWTVRVNKRENIYRSILGM